MTNRLNTRYAFLLLLALGACAPDRPSSNAGDWPVHGGDPGGMKYSALTEINRDTVSQLQPAWTWEPGEAPIPGPRQPIPGQDVRPGAFETTPIMLDGTMYLSTPYNRVVALNPETGQEIWTYDPQTIEWGQPPNGTGYVHRGVAIWRGSNESRIFLNSRWRLIALDAKTGAAIESFGHKGEIDLTDNLLWPTNRLHYTQTSPPVIYENLVILGNGVWDGFIYERDPPGNVQAFDVRTGELVWNFNLIPQPGEVGNETWEEDSWDRTGHTNVWAPFTLDSERGYLYLPVGTPSNDYYGGHRKGDNLFAESLLCLNARTGERVWHFQAVHHGLWDYDLGSPPALLTVTVEDRTIDVVAAPSKMGFVYVFDRETGEPVWPIEERPVPPSDVPGERAAATQPFPTRPAPFAPQGLTEDDLIDFTPELRAEALRLIQAYRYGSLYLPPSLQGTIALPGIVGGTNYGGPAADPETGVFYVKATNSPNLLALVKSDPSKTEGDYIFDRTKLGLRLSNGLPLLKPPYGTLTAIDLKTGEHLWQVPVGDNPRVRFHPALQGVELPPRLGAEGPSGPIVTAGGLVFVTGGANSLHAFDKETGKELWSADLGSRSAANPMTYLGSSGRQFVVIASGSGSRAKLTAFALQAVAP